MNPSISQLLLAAAVALTLQVAATPERDAEVFASAIDKINASHLRDPGTTTEAELLDEIPASALKALERVLKAKPSDESKKALLKCGQAALDLAALEPFGRIRSRLLELDPDAAAALGDAVARERFLVRGIGDFEDGYLDDFADITDAILDAYDDVFGFAEWSKVPGKKIRIRVHLEDRITNPPHFAPQFPYHSEIDMPVIDRTALVSPTPQGQMMFYGLCHELGHLIAMWGDRNTMEDHHAWAHYTGVVIVEHMAGKKDAAETISKLRDVRWRSLTLEREKEENQVPPSTRDRADVMALLIKLHDTVGPKVIGSALNLMDDNAMGHRINQVRYYSFEDLHDALAQVVPDAEVKAQLGAIFP